MKGADLKVFFDFMQRELEMSLEKLSWLIVKDLTEYLDYDEQKNVTMNPSFFAFKQQAT